MSDEALTNTNGGIITATDGAWEFIYSILEDFVERGVSVVINDTHTVTLTRFEGGARVGDLLSGDAPGRPVVIIGKAWDEAAKDYTGDEVRIRAYNDDGTTAISKVHVL